jgi:type V secretory pathway adhesin AidA
MSAARPTARFSLLGDAVVNGEEAVLAGAYAYCLFQGAPTETDGDWYLRSIGFTASATAYETYPILSERP